jgi:hypothetical protein
MIEPSKYPYDRTPRPCANCGLRPGAQHKRYAHLFRKYCSDECSWQSFQDKLDAQGLTDAPAHRAGSARAVLVGVR